MPDQLQFRAVVGVRSRVTENVERKGKMVVNLNEKQRRGRGREKAGGKGTCQAKKIKKRNKNKTHG